MELILDLRTEIAWEFGGFAVISSTGASEALLKDGVYEVDSEGKRRRHLDVL